MSSVVDEDTARTINSGRESLGALLSAAQTHLQKVFMVFVVGLVGTIWALRVFVWDLLKENTRSRMSESVAGQVDIIAQTPFDVILLQVKIGLVVGVVLCIPPLLYYAREPLRERGYTSAVPIGAGKIALFVLVSILLFVGGVVYAYAVFFPFMFSFLAENAISATIKPSYSIVLWTQFLLLLTLSFGLAAQLPLAMSILSYTEIIPYETFRDKWRYAVMGIFVFGAVFSPPDPFTQVMWALPLVLLYVLSLGLAKVVTNIRRAGADPTSDLDLRRNALVLLGAGVLVGAVAALLVQNGTVSSVYESVRPSIPAFARPGETLGLQSYVDANGTAGLAAVALGAGGVAVVLTLMAFTVQVLRSPVRPRDGGRMGTPDLNLDTLDAGGVRAAPIEAFMDLSEDEALDQARAAMDADRPEKAEAIFDRFDEAQELRAQREAAEAAGEEVAETATGPTAGSNEVPEAAVEGATRQGATEEEEGGVLTSTAAGMVDPFTEEETTEDDIGGYYYDIAFILESLTSKAFRIVGVFMLVLAGTFFWLYQGGLGTIREDFLARIPPEVLAEVGGAENLGLVIALHPVEALIFEVKVSTILGFVAVLPMLAYYAWPALKQRGLASGERSTFLVWGVAILLGFVGGSALGYAYVAPTIISYLVSDAIQAGMVISYRLKNFFWLIFLTTAGIGLLADVLVTMWLFHWGGIVSFESMYRRWRVVVIAIFAVAGFFTPSGILTMFIVAIPLSLTYLLGLGVLWVLTLPRRARGGGGEPATP